MSKRVRHHANPLAILKEITFSGFGNDKPIIVDVGAFKGEFIEALNQKLPDYNFVAFELRTLVADALREKFAEQDNIMVFDGDAGRNFQNILQPCLNQGAKITEIFVNFPDPWFKDRHKKRRFLQADFADKIADWLPSETEIVFQTDQQFLFEETLEDLQGSVFNQFTFFKGSAHGIPTDWEAAKIALGETIHRVKIKQQS